MRLAADGTLRLSPSDLANHLACAELAGGEDAIVLDEAEVSQAAPTRARGHLPGHSRARLRHAPRR